MKKEESSLTAQKKELEYGKKKNSAAKKKEKDDGLQMVSVNDIDKKEVNAKKKKTFLFSAKIRIVITILAGAVFCASAWQLYNIFSEYKKGEDEYEDVENQYTTVDVNLREETDEGENYNNDSDIMPYEKVNVDFNGLKSLNPDIVAWIQFEHMDISYPVVRGGDNDYYLTHTFRKTENSAGAIFMDCDNNSDMSDYNTIIYGHNMKNGSMFGLLGRYKEEEYYPGRDCFWIYTPEVDYRYQIFSCHEPQADDSNVYTIWKSSEKFDTYVNHALKVAKYNTNVSVNGEDRVVTLSTCTKRGSDYRFVVQGKLIEAIPK